MPRARPFQGWYWKRKRLLAWSKALMGRRDRESITSRPGAQKLNIGAGRRPLPGWINLDVEDLPGIDIVCDARSLERLPPASFDIVRASHILEHLYLRDVPGVLASWSRLLKPGGHLMVCVPDFRGFVESYLDDPGIIDVAGISGPIDWDEPRESCGYLVRVFGGWYDTPAHAHMKHRMVYDRDSLSRLLEVRAELEEVWEFDYRHEEPYILGIEDDSTNSLSLNVVGRKSAEAAAEAESAVAEEDDRAQ